MPRSYKVKFMGKDMTFTPGEGGSLRYQADMSKEALDLNPKNVSKAVPSKLISEEIKKKRNILNKSIIGAVRG